MGQLGQPAPVWHNLRRQPGGCGQGEHHERRGGLHGRRQDHCQRPDDVQVKQNVASNLSDVCAGSNGHQTPPDLSFFICSEILGSKSYFCRVWQND